ncbi:MAG: N-acetylmuramoyl-L-alanine amidase [Smithella sp.]|jgi:N-acetylmuramoyl-L-alanine amidase
MFTKKKIFLLLGVLMSFLILTAFGSFAAEKKRIIMIDPAHGGKEQGIKLTSDVYEKNITLAVALAVQKELSGEKNMEVVLTRDSDKTIDLEERRKMVDKIKPDFFISLHVNGGFGKDASGFELYYPTFAEEMTGDRKTAKNDKAKLRNNCQNDSLKMAKIVQENLNSLFPRKGRGLRKADSPITEGLLVPALSIEMGFATNQEDKKKLLSSKTQTGIAKSLVKSVKIFFR